MRCTLALKPIIMPNRAKAAITESKIRMVWAGLRHSAAQISGKYFKPAPHQYHPAAGRTDGAHKSLHSRLPDAGRTACRRTAARRRGYPPAFGAVRPAWTDLSPKLSPAFHIVP